MCSRLRRQPYLAGSKFLAIWVSQAALMVRPSVVAPSVAMRCQGMRGPRLIGALSGCVGLVPSGSLAWGQGSMCGRCGWGLLHRAWRCGFYARGYAGGMTPTTLIDTDADRLSARHLYWMGWRIARIAEHLDIPRATIDSWKKRDGWDEASPSQRVEGALEARMVQLIWKERKEGIDFKELDLLGRQIERLARVHKYERTGKEADLNPNIERRNAGEKRKPKRN